MIDIIQKERENAINKQLPKFEGKLPPIATPEFILEIIEEVAVYLVISICEISKPFLEKGEIPSREHQGFLDAYDANINTDSKRIEILLRKGLKTDEHHVLEYYTNAVFKYSENEDFERKVALLESKCKDFIKLTFSGELSLPL